MAGVADRDLPCRRSHSRPQPLQLAIRYALKRCGGLALAQPFAVFLRRFRPAARAPRPWPCALIPSCFRSAARQVDNPTLREWAAVVDPHDNPTPGIERSHLDIGRQRQGGVRGGDPAGAKLLAIGGAFSRLAAVPAGIAKRGRRPARRRGHRSRRGWCKRSRCARACRRLAENYPRRRPTVTAPVPQRL